jgi:RNA polymerase sigma factor (sigma-70 family)
MSAVCTLSQTPLDMKPKSNAPADETYEEVRRWVSALVTKAKQTWPNLNKHEARNEAYLGYCQAYATYDPSKCSFMRWVTVKVRSAILDYMRKEINRAKKATKLFSQIEAASDEPFEPEARDVRKFEVNRWMSQLSPDARRVSKLVLFSVPARLKEILAQGDEDKKLAYRNAVRRYLAEQGWPKRRTDRAFAEIKLALTTFFME